MLCDVFVDVGQLGHRCCHVCCCCEVFLYLGSFNGGICWLGCKECIGGFFGTQAKHLAAPHGWLGTKEALGELGICVCKVFGQNRRIDNDGMMVFSSGRANSSPNTRTRFTHSLHALSTHAMHPPLSMTQVNCFQV